MNFINTVSKTSVLAIMFSAIGALIASPAFAHSEKSYGHAQQVHKKHDYRFRPDQHYGHQYERHYRDHYRGQYRDHHRDYPRSTPQAKACVPIKVVSYGGVGGFRTTDRIKDFKRIHDRAYKGKLCGKRSVEIELSKMDPRTKTVLFIAGQKYVFRPFEHADRYANNWYRKYVQINLNHFYPRHYSKVKKSKTVRKLDRLHDFHHRSDYLKDSNRYRHGRYY